MFDHFIFIFYIYLFIFSTVGYGFFFSKLVKSKLIQLNLGYQGIIGFFFLSLISTFSSYFVAHNYIHNLIIHIIGLTFFIVFFFKFYETKDLKKLLLITFILIIGCYVYKNHDDFPYYHLTYSLNLSENSFIIGTGIFSHGFRTFSSLFYYHSLLYMPGINFYLFHSGPFLILVFFNISILSELRERFKSSSINFSYYFALLSFILINVVFYRIGEHGTDRSAQILLILIFLQFFDILYFQKDRKQILIKINLFLIMIFLASSMKAIYYLYILLVPILFFKKKLFKYFFLKKNILIISFLSLSLCLNLITNFFNTGCFLYPSKKTCILETEWSIPKKEVELMATHYEWWAKAGGGPGYSSEIKKEDYVKNFVWLDNWIDKHFFNKVSDFLLGLILICIIFYLTVKINSSKGSKQFIKIDYLAYLVPSIFLIEWFLNHPSMRYGGFILVALPFLIFTSSQLQKYFLNREKLYFVTIFFIILTLVIYNGRNFQRLNKEINFYKYNLVKSPYFFTQDVVSLKVFKKNNFEIYSPKNQMCWASKTPCSYHKKFNHSNFLWMNVVSRDDK